MRRAPSFWWSPRRDPQALLLWPFSALYGAVAGWRMGRPPRARAPVPVVCVGNFVVGGAGKTPTALALARIARAEGLKPGFLSRGHGGSETGPLLVDPEEHGAEKVGDEPLLLAAAAPTVVSRERPRGVPLLIEEGVDLIIMDDGFQNPSLGKDFSFVVVDGETGTGNGMVLPAGPLRAPLARQMRHADALVIVGGGTGAEGLVRAMARLGRPVLRARLKPARVRDWRKTPILAFAGIGRPEKFFASLAAVNAPVQKTMRFPDHHRFTEAEAERLLAMADEGGLRLVTTEKDLARLAGATGASARLRERSEAFAVVLEFENAVAIEELVSEIGRGVGRARR